MLQKMTVGKSVWIMYKDFVCISCKISLSLKIIKNKNKTFNHGQLFVNHGLHNFWLEILQARILEWVACPFLGIFLTQESNRVSCIARGFFTNWAIREALKKSKSN